MFSGTRMFWKAQASRICSSKLSPRSHLNAELSHERKCRKPWQHICNIYAGLESHAYRPTEALTSYTWKELLDSLHSMIWYYVWQDEIEGCHGNNNGDKRGCGIVCGHCPQKSSAQRAPMQRRDWMLNPKHLARVEFATAIWNDSNRVCLNARSGGSNCKN